MNNIITKTNFITNTPTDKDVYLSPTERWESKRSLFKRDLAIKILAIATIVTLGVLLGTAVCATSIALGVMGFCFLPATATLGVCLGIFFSATAITLSPFIGAIPAAFVIAPPIIWAHNLGQNYASKRTMLRISDQLGQMTLQNLRENTLPNSRHSLSINKLIRYGYISEDLGVELKNFQKNVQNYHFKMACIEKSPEFNEIKNRQEKQEKVLPIEEEYQYAKDQIKAAEEKWPELKTILMGELPR